jgi:NAD(P)-dependent dehydrogenase (short-subunit alcohol dehydrogenase family)
VSGSNRGLGLGIVKIILQKGYRVIMVSREEKRGQDVFENLLKEFPSHKDDLFFHQLDISDKTSVANIAKWIKEKFGQIDILFNNAATAFGENEIALKWIEDNKSKIEFSKGDGSVAQMETIELFDGIFSTNIYGTINLSETFLKDDLIKKNGKIITIASSTGNATRLVSESLKKELTAENLTLDQVLSFASRYKNAIVNKTISEEGWIQHIVPVYSNSKILTQVYSRSLAQREIVKERGIQVYACCPGWVRTDLGGENGARSIEQGAVTPVYMIDLKHTLNPNMQGKFFYDCAPYDWINSPVPDFK